MQFKATLLMSDPNGNGRGRERRMRKVVEFEAGSAAEAAQQAHLLITEAPKWVKQVRVSVEENN